MHTNEGRGDSVCDDIPKISSVNILKHASFNLKLFFVTPKPRDFVVNM